MLDLYVKQDFSDKASSSSPVAPPAIERWIAALASTSHSDISHLSSATRGGGPTIACARRRGPEDPDQEPDQGQKRDQVVIRYYYAQRTGEDPLPICAVARLMGGELEWSRALAFVVQDFL